LWGVTEFIQLRINMLVSSHPAGTNIATLWFAMTVLGFEFSFSSLWAMGSDRIYSVLWIPLLVSSHLVIGVLGQNTSLQSGWGVTEFTWEFLIPNSWVCQFRLMFLVCVL
jgi:hypothetical protein